MPKGRRFPELYESLELRMTEEVIRGETFINEKR
jgi:hypothetical protein